MEPLSRPSLIRVYVEPTPSPTDPPGADELYRALSIAIIAWGRLEGHFTASLLSILNVATDPRIGKKLPMKWERCIYIWRIAFDFTQALKPYGADAETFIVDMDALARHRNKISHGLWEFFRPHPPLAIDFINIRARSGTPNGLWHSRGFINIEWLAKFTADANRLNLDLMKLSTVLSELRGAPPSDIRIL